MSFLLLLVLALACLWQNWPGPLEWAGNPPNRFLCTALTWACVAAVVAAALGIAQWTCRQSRHQPEQSERIHHRYRRWRFYHGLLQFSLYALELFGLGWGWTVQSLGPGSHGKPEMPPGGELLVLAPFVAALVLSWACFYDAERGLHSSASPEAGTHPFWSRRAYVSFHVRQNLALIVVPLALLIVEQGLRRYFVDTPNEWIFQVGVLGLLIAAFVGLPWALRAVLRLKPLPEGLLRQRLLATSGRLNFRCSNILLWDTHGGVANAMVAGVFPWIRYVVLTDRLMSELSPEELEAVFGHEIGHVKYHHILYYLGFFFVSLAVVAGLWHVAQLDTWFQTNEDIAMVPLLVLLAAYIFVVFGFLSRRCERQADLFGCRSVSCGRLDCAGHEGEIVPLSGGKGLCPTGIHTFIEALEKVARLNGINRSRPGWLQSWQHSTIARRVEFLEHVCADPTLELRFQRKVRLVKWGLLVGLGAVLVILGLTTQGWAKLLTL